MLKTTNQYASKNSFRYLATKAFLPLFFILLASFFTACNFSDKKEKAQVSIEKSSYLKDEFALQHGMELFNQHCASCHNFNESVIGPSLGGITSNVDKDWLIGFIKDPKQTIENGDARGNELYKKYKIYMPSFPTLNDKDLEDLLAFMNKFSEGEKKSRNKRSGAILNPIADKIATSDLVLVIEDFLTVPPSSESNLRTRINKISAVQTKQGERLFIADLRGKLSEAIDTTTHVYLDIKVACENFIDNPGRASGFGSFAFHPEFEKNGLIYTTHTEHPKTSPADFAIHDSIPTTLQWVLTEWKSDEPSARQFSGKKRELLRADMVGGAHGFQEVTFNPLAKKGDAEYGLLYLGIGDGSAALAGYPFLCDNTGKIWGSIIRIDPSGRNSQNGKYGIPEDNPFVNEKDKLGEIWNYGHRNPHRISWDANSGKMFSSNIGQHSLEEVNLGKKAANYGWPDREGTFLFDVDANTEVVYPLPDDDSGFTYPVIQYDHDEGNAVSGGFAYTGTKIPLLNNKYIFGDIARGTLFYSTVTEITEGKQAPIYKMGLELNGKLTSLGDIAGDQRVDLRFGEDSSGELFIFTKSNGKVYRLIACKTINDQASAGIDAPSEER